MRTLLFVLALALLVASSLPAAEGNVTHALSKRFGDGETQAAFGSAVDVSGNIFITGLLKGSTSFGGPMLGSMGSGDVFLAKFDAGGNHLWSRRFGDASGQHGCGVEVDGAGGAIAWGGFKGSVDFGGGLLVNSYDMDVYAAKYDANGNHLWSKSFGGAAYLDIRDLAIDALRNPIFTGAFLGAVNFGGSSLSSAGKSDIYIAKLSSQGAHLWSKRFGDGSAQLANSIALDPAGNILVAGEFAGSLDLGGGALTSAGSHDIFLAKFSPSGAHLWSKCFGSEEYQSGQCVAADRSGNVIITGCFEGDADFGGGALASANAFDVFLAKFDPAGNHLWSKRFGDGANQYGWSIAVENSGNILVTGGISGTIDFGDGALTSAEGSTDIFIAEFDPNGNCLFSAGIGDVEADFGMSISRTATGFLLAGYFGGKVDFGGGPLLSAGKSDAFLAKFNLSNMDAVEGLAGTPVYWGSKLLGLRLAWNRCRDMQISHYNVYRDVDEHFIPGRGNLIAMSADTVTNDGQWSWLPGYYYKVTAVDLAGNESAYASLGNMDIRVGVQAPPPPPSVSLEQNFPNPFNPATSICYYLPNECPVTFEVFNTAGKLMSRLLDHTPQREGTHSVVWKGVDDRGNAMSSGIYFYRLRAGDKTISKKMVLIK